MLLATLTEESAEAAERVWNKEVSSPTHPPTHPPTHLLKESAEAAERVWNKEVSSPTHPPAPTIPSSQHSTLSISPPTHPFHTHSSSFQPPHSSSFFLCIQSSPTQSMDALTRVMQAHPNHPVLQHFHLPSLPTHLPTPIVQHLIRKLEKQIIFPSPTHPPTHPPTTVNGRSHPSHASPPQPPRPPALRSLLPPKPC